MFFSIERLIGFIIRSPALVRPPNRMIASGLENATKSANASPRMLPVNSKISKASLSFFIAASYTSLDVISSGSNSRSKLSSLRISRNSRAVRATPVAEAYASKGKHIITSKIEHHAILHTCDYLASRGYEITYIDVDENGVIKLDQLKAAIRPDTILISVMFANNEIGTIQPIEEIGAIAKEHGVLFHTDAVQAYCQVPIDVDKMHIDMLSISGHKINGPKGIGFLYIRKGVKIRSFVHGGAQERSRRAGTENIPGIVGLGAAVERAMRIMDSKTRKEIELRDYLIGRLENEIPHCWLNGHRTKRLPNNINFSFLFIEGESMLIMLDMKGICASSGSACTSGSLDPSHVLLAIGLKHEEAHGSLRLTLSEDSTKEEMDIVAEEVKKIVQRLRDMSPLYEDFLKSQKNN